MEMTPTTTSAANNGREIIGDTPGNPAAEVACPVCGGPVVRPGGRGRPASYHPECAELERVMRRLESALLRAHYRLPEGEEGKLPRRALRGRVMGIMNLLNAKGGA